jgi:hypothetical protein
MADSSTEYEAGMATAATLKTKSKSKPYRNFYAYEHAISSKLLLVRVAGEVLVGNPGIVAVLRYAEPQGINPAILLLRLDLIQKPGLWPTLMTWARAKYSALLIKKGAYKQVTIVNDDLGSITIDVIPV